MLIQLVVLLPVRRPQGTILPALPPPLFPLALRRMRLPLPVVRLLVGKLLTLMALRRPLLLPLVLVARLMRLPLLPARRLLARLLPVRLMLGLPLPAPPLLGLTLRMFPLLVRLQWRGGSVLTGFRLPCSNPG